VPKAAFFASRAEKAYRAAVAAYLGGDYRTCAALMEDVLAADATVVSAHLFAGVAASAIDDRPRAIGHLEAVAQGTHPLPDRYEEKYLPEARFSRALGVRITDSITAQAPFSELGAVLSLVELYQDGGRLEEAIGLLQQLHEAATDPLVRVSLCDLLFADQDYEGVIELSTGAANESDLDVELLHLRAAAFAAKGLGTAAIDTFRAALSKTTRRDAGLLRAVRYDRALAYEQLGQHAGAKADLERLYEVDPSYEDVRERLAAMA
jgi:tetratricopeptide (TPR) repeat protein